MQLLRCCILRQPEKPETDCQAWKGHSEPAHQANMSQQRVATDCNHPLAMAVGVELSYRAHMLQSVTVCTNRKGSEVM